MTLPLPYALTSPLCPYALTSPLCPYLPYDLTSLMPVPMTLSLPYDLTSPLINLQLLCLTQRPSITVWTQPYIGHTVHKMSHGKNKMVPSGQTCLCFLLSVGEYPNFPTGVDRGSTKSRCCFPAKKASR